MRLRAAPDRTGFGESTLSQWRLDGVEASASLQDPAYVPRISYFTIMSTFMYIAYATLAASVFVRY